MNAPFAATDLPLGGTARLQVFAFFHLNLSFSSIEEERRGEVIARCYWPLLELAERCGPIGIEACGYTLEEIAARDPAWIAKARALIAAGRVELIGSGYSQMIGPLAPARVTAENLRLGQETCEKLLGVRPRVALINEQAYAGGLVALYCDAGFDAIIMDFENPSAQHPEWSAETRYLPQYAVGPQGRTDRGPKGRPDEGPDRARIALLWSNTTAFQQLQRLAHGDTTPETYRSFVRGHQGARALCLYASDAEIFDFRPGRFKTEEKLSGDRAGNLEWARIERAFAQVAADGADFVAPSAVLEMLQRPGAGQELVLESPAVPVPVKKQRKYNLARWAVTGRDNLAINAACERIYEGMLREHRPGRVGAAITEPPRLNDASGFPSGRATQNKDWKELCYLWASDFRTHLTEKRWQAYCARLEAAEARWSAPPPAPIAVPAVRPCEERHIAFETPAMTVRLDRRRGLAIQSLRFAGHDKAAIGGLPHGSFDDIALAADWYTGDCVFEAPGEHKLTDLEWCEARIAPQDNGDVIAFARIDTARGVIEKHMRFAADAPRVDFDLTFHWQDWGKGVLRLGHFTLLPDAFMRRKLTLATNNGGGRESFALAGHTIDHGAPVSFLVSSSHGIGMTEGWAEIGDGKTGLRVTVDRAAAPLLGMLVHRTVKDRNGAASLFCQLQLSALELDDTSKPGSYRTGPRRFRFSLGAL